MGVLAAAQRNSPWAQDPEALLIFTLEIARLDPRLFDEVLDWVLVNEPLLSVRRLRALCDDDEDVRLVDALLAWLSRHRPRARLQGGSAAKRTGPAEPLFPALPAPTTSPDPAFEEHGFLRPIARPTGKAGSPNLSAPINLGFRLRHVLGVGARAEVMRFLLTTDAPRVTAQVVARTAGFSKRNVHEALTSLQAADVITATSIGVEQRYAADRTGWAHLLHVDPDGWPAQRDFPQLLGALRAILRALRAIDAADLSDYLVASEIREALERARPHLEYAGVRVGRQQTADTALADLRATLEGALGLLGVGLAESTPDAR